jgi:uncharacterized protein (TIGR02266 family)
VSVALEIEYRSAGAFLVAYSTNLSKGGLFIETGAPLPVGTALSLRLRLPEGTTMDVDGVVAWIRARPSDDGRPPGMGIELGTPDERYGTVVDQIVARFSGIQILLGTGEAAPRATLNRYLRSILACEIVEVEDTRQLEAAAPRLDLAVVDMDSSGARGEHLLRRLREGPERDSLPIIALAHNEADRQRAAELGADETVPNPPTFADLQAAVIRCLARPSAIR